MIKDPLFSVLIANYNNGKYIEEAINSVLEQSYPHWEIIIVDDKSTDNSVDIYKKFQCDKRVKVYFNKDNRGVTYTKWRCIELCNGDICGFLDADDVILPNALNLMIEAHLNDDEVSIVSSRFYNCDENMNILGESGYLSIPKGESYLTQLKYEPWPFISFKKEKYKQTKGLNYNNKIGDDQELCILLEETGKWAILNDITYKYRHKFNSLSNENLYKCLYWNLMVYHEACVRRGLDPEKYSFKNFLEISKRVGIDYVVSNSIRYKVGSIIIAPIFGIVKIIKRICGK